MINQLIMLVKRKRFRQWFRGPVAVMILFLIIGTVHVTYVIYKGPLIAPDTDDYLNWANYLITHNFNYLKLYFNNFSVESESSHILFMRFGFSSIVAFCKIILNSNWLYGVLIFNLFMYLLAIYTILFFVWKLTKDVFTLVFCSVICLISNEMLLWVNYILTDSSFMSIVFLILFSTTNFLLPKANSFNLKLSIFGLVILSLFWRPTAIPIILFIFIILISKQLIRKFPNIKILLLIDITFITLIFIISSYYFLFNSHSQHITNIIGFSHWNFVSDRVYGFDNIFFNSPYKNILSPALYYIIKFITYFTFINQEFSVSHIVANSIFFIPVYSFSFFAIYSFFKKPIYVNNNLVIATFAITLFIMSFGLFHTIIAHIDYDWRYRLPIIPVLIALSSIGFYEFRRLLKLRT